MAVSVGTAFLEVKGDLSTLNRDVNRWASSSSTGFRKVEQGFKRVETSATGGFRRITATASGAGSATRGLQAPLRNAAGEADRLGAKAKGAGRDVAAFGSSSERTGGALSGVTKHLLAFGAGFLGVSAGIGAAKRAVSTTEELAKGTLALHRNLGFTIEDASRWAAVAKARGIDTTDLSTSFTSLSKNVIKSGKAVAIQVEAERELGRIRKTATVEQQALIDQAVSAKTGSLKQLTAIGQLTKAHGGLSKTQKELFNNALKAGKGAEEQTAAFKSLGLSQEEIIRGSKDFPFLLSKVAEGFGKMEGGPKRAALAQQLLGRSSQNTLPIFTQGAKAMENQLALADKYGVTLHGKTIKSVKDLIQVQKELEFAQLGLQVQFTQTFGPALLAAFKGVNAFAGGIRGAVEAVKEFDLSKVSKDIGLKLNLGKVDFGDAGGAIDSSLASIKSIIDSKLAHLIGSDILGTLKKQVAGIGQIFRGAADVIAGTLKLIDDIVHVRIGKAFGDMAQIVKGGVNLAIGALRAFTAPVREIMARVGRALLSPLRSAWQNVKDVFSGGVSGALRSLRGMVGDAGSIAGRAGKAIASGFRSALTGIRSVANDIVGVIKRIPGRLGDVGAGILRALKSGLSGATLIPSFKVKGPGPLPDISFPAVHLPSFAKGGKVKHSLALVGEEGPELAKLPTGKMTMVGLRGPEIRELPVGTRVHSHPETKRKLASVSQDIFQRLVPAAIRKPKPLVQSVVQSEITQRFAKGGKVKKDKKKKDKPDKSVPTSAAIDFAHAAWPVVAPYLHAGGMPMPRVRFSKRESPIIVTSQDKAGLTYTLGPPSWARGLAKRQPKSLQALVHEWAHVFQLNPANYTQEEGGAQAFARRVAPQVASSLGVPYAQDDVGRDPFKHELRRLQKRKGKRTDDFVMNRQFGYRSTGTATKALKEEQVSEAGKPWYEVGSLPPPKRKKKGEAGAKAAANESTVGSLWGKFKDLIPGAARFKPSFAITDDPRGAGEQTYKGAPSSNLPRATRGQVWFPRWAWNDIFGGADGPDFTRWAKTSLVHEHVHGVQSLDTLKTRREAEGGAVLFSERYADQLMGPASLYRASGQYRSWANQMNKRGEDWITHGQFEPDAVKKKGKKQSKQEPKGGTAKASQKASRVRGASEEFVSIAERTWGLLKGRFGRKHARIPRIYTSIKDKYGTDGAEAVTIQGKHDRRILFAKDTAHETVKGDDFGLNSLVHEFAHTQQDRGVFNSRRLGEGGAVGFSLLNTPSIAKSLGMKYDNASVVRQLPQQYSNDYIWVTQHRDKDWIQRGQFQAFGKKDAKASAAGTKRGAKKADPKGQPDREAHAAGKGKAAKASGRFGGILSRANKLDSKHLPYKLGGGHGSIEQAFKSGFDCSGAVSYALGIDPRVSGQFGGWGKSGEGEISTFSNASHVVMSILGKLFGTGDKTGPHWLAGGPAARLSGGFATRHIGKDGDWRSFSGADGKGKTEEPAAKLQHHGRFSLGQMVTLAKRAGFQDPALAAAVGYAESLGNTAAHHKTAKEDSRGLWQINVKDNANPQYKKWDLSDAFRNVTAAYKVSGGGKNWKPWSKYTSGDYKQYLGAKGAPLPKGTSKGTPTGSSYAEYLTMKMTEAEGTPALKDDLRWINRAMRYYRGIYRRNKKIGNFGRANEALGELNTLKAKKAEIKAGDADPEILTLDSGLAKIGTGPKAFNLAFMADALAQIDLEKANASLTIPPDDDDSAGALTRAYADDIPAASKLVNIWDGIKKLTDGYWVTPQVQPPADAPGRIALINQTIAKEKKKSHTDWKRIHKLEDERERLSKPHGGNYVIGTGAQQTEAATNLASARSELKGFQDEIGQKTTDEARTKITDRLRALASLAALTPGKDDDVAAVKEAIKQYEIDLSVAQQGTDQGAIADAAEALKGARDDLKSLTGEIASEKINFATAFVDVFKNFGSNFRKLPAFAKGGVVRALVGEQGFELAKLPNQKVTLVGGQGPEIRELPVGTRIYPHGESKRKLSESIRVPAFAKGGVIQPETVQVQEGPDIERVLARLEKALKDQPPREVNIDARPTFTETPKDAHNWSRSLAFELEAAT